MRRGDLAGLRLRAQDDRAVAGDMRGDIRERAGWPFAGLEQIGVAQFSLDLERELVARQHGADRRRPAYLAFLDRLGHPAGDRRRDRADQGAGSGERYRRRARPLPDRTQADRAKAGDGGAHQRRLVRTLPRTHEARPDGFRLQLHHPLGTDRRRAAARDVAGIHGALRGGKEDREPGMTSHISDMVPRDNPGTREIGFAIPENYNASRILFDNLRHDRGDRLALTGPGGTLTYAQLCAEASQWGHGFQSLGLKRGDRILMFLDDTPVYPAAFFGAVRSGFVPLLINTLTPPDLLQFFLSDAGAAVAVAEAEFTSRFNAEACKDTPLQTLIVVNGAAGEHAVPKTFPAQQWLQGFSTDLPEADTRRDDMAFWMYSSGSTGRPKGIVHLQHDMAYSEQAFARNVLKLTPDDICFSVPKIFFAYGFGNSITFPFSVGAATLLLPGQPKPATIFEAIEKYRPSVFYGLPTLYTSLTKAEGAAATNFSSLRMARSAAEVLSAEVFNGWKTLTGLEIVEGLGSTEVLHIYLSNRPEKKKLGAAGLRVPGYELLLRDKDGRDVGNSEEGIVWVRGESNTPLYWNRPDKSAETIRDG